MRGSGNKQAFYFPLLVGFWNDAQDFERRINTVFIISDKVLNKAIKLFFSNREF